MNIKSLRKKLKVTQEGLARKIGVSWSTVNRWEREIGKPSPLALQKLEELEKDTKN